MTIKKSFCLAILAMFAGCTENERAMRKSQEFFKRLEKGSKGTLLNSTVLKEAKRIVALLNAHDQPKDQTK